MASNVALFTGLSGLNAYSKSLEVIGNNIANVNTNAYKSTRLIFSESIQQTISMGSSPNDEAGGTNPTQIGLGVRVAGTQRDMTQGSISTTGNARDMAIEGNGFFAVSRAGEQLYTRAGAFRRDAVGNLATVEGDVLLGLLADEDFVIPDQGQLEPIAIPLGALTIAEATRNASLAGNLDADGPLPTQGASVDIFGAGTTGLSLISTATVPPGPGNILETSSLLVEIEDPAQPGSDVPLFTAGQVLEVSGVRVGSATVPDSQFTITATSTVQEMMDFFMAAMGIHDTGENNPDGVPPGLSLDATTGVLTVTGNTGEANDLEVPANAFRLFDAQGVSQGTVFAPDKTASADGESVRTSFVVFDSLGSPLTVRMSMVAEARTNEGTSWRYFVDSPYDTDADKRLASGTIDFDTSGRLADDTAVSVQIDRDNTGAETPMAFNLSFGSETDGVTALAGRDSQLAVNFTDGSPIGTLQDYSVSRDGTVIGFFSNSLTRPLARVSLAAFTNPAGLVDRGSNLFAPGPNSGEAAVVNPGQFGTGAIISGALEQSNVDLGNEFIKLILTSTGYSASGRVIRTADELMQQLLVLGR